MPNPIFRNWIRTSIQDALRKFHDATEIDHSGLQGRIREIAVRTIIDPLLFEHLSTGTGKIVDFLGNQSKETDCVIYSTRHLPALMYESKLGVFPVDATYFAIEIKSCLTAATLREAYNQASSLPQLQYSTWHYREHDGRHIDYCSPLVPALFAFDSDLSGSGKSELDRYLKIDGSGQNKPMIWMICVIGRGFWWYNHGPDGSAGEWIFHEATAEFDEVIDFMAITSIFIDSRVGSRPVPKLSSYLIDINIEKDGTVTRR